jgi:predicted Fe-S protein YdhL (DUF1289 family)
MKTNNWGMGGFFARSPFGFGHEGIRAQWSKMTDEEKKAVVEERINRMNELFAKNSDSSTRGGKITVEEIDKRCEEWQTLSAEEKEAFVKKRNRWAEHAFCVRSLNFMQCGFRF